MSASNRPQRLEPAARIQLQRMLSPGDHASALEGRLGLRFPFPRVMSGAPLVGTWSITSTERISDDDALILGRQCLLVKIRLRDKLEHYGTSTVRRWDRQAPEARSRRGRSSLGERPVASLMNRAKARPDLYPRRTAISLMLDAGS